MSSFSNLDLTLALLGLPHAAQALEAPIVLGGDDARLSARRSLRFPLPAQGRSAFTTPARPVGTGAEVKALAALEAFARGCEARLRKAAPKVMRLAAQIRAQVQAFRARAARNQERLEAAMTGVLLDPMNKRAGMVARALVKGHAQACSWADYWAKKAGSAWRTCLQGLDRVWLEATDRVNRFGPVTAIKVAGARTCAWADWVTRPSSEVRVWQA